MKRLGALRILAPTLLVAAACASGFLQYEKADQLKDIKEFDQAVKIDAPEEPAATPTPEPAEAAAVTATPTPTLALKPTPARKPVAEKKIKKSKRGKKGPEAVDLNKHEPELEGQNGFVGRRPAKDPFRVGEKLTYEVSYFGVKAGDLVMSVKPFAQVNGQKAYHFELSLKSSPLFAAFYEVDDKVTSMVDFDTLVPRVFTLHVQETGQLREARFLHDPATKSVSYWERKVTKANGPEEKKQHWEVPDYSQDVFSSAFYLRVFPWEVGKEVAFRVADNEENLVFKGTALRKETLSSRAGDFPAIVIKPEVHLAGQFKPMGDIFIWLSDDDHHYILRIEAKIKIGTMVAQITELNPGHDESP